MADYNVAETFVSINGEGVMPVSWLYLSVFMAAIFPALTAIPPGPKKP